MKPIRLAHHVIACLSLIFALLFQPRQSLARTADPTDSTFKDWYYTPTGVFGRLPLANPKYRTYVKITRPSANLVTVQKFNPAGILINTFYVNFLNGQISLLTQTNQWGESFDSTWFKPDGPGQFIVTEKLRGVNPNLPCKALRLTYKNNLLQDMLCLTDSTKPGPNQEGVAHYVYERYSDPALFGLIKTATYFTDIDMPAISRNTGCHKLVNEYDKDANLVDISTYGPDDKPMADQWGAFRTRMKYDHDDNLTETDYFDGKGSLTTTAYGYAQAVKEYKKGFVTKETFYNRDNIIITASRLADSVAIIEHRYDQSGNETERDYYDPLGQDMDNTEGMHKILLEYSANAMLIRGRGVSIHSSQATKIVTYVWTRFTRDEKGREIATSDISENNLVIPNREEGANITKYRYDNWGRVVSTSFWQNDSVKTLGLDGYHERISRYNEDGQLIESDNYDEQGKPTKSFTGYSRQVIHYNDQGLVSELEYDDGNTPVLMEDKNTYSSHFHSVRYKYDWFNRVRQLDYYDCAGQPVNALLWFPDNKNLTGQRLEFKYAGPALAEEDIHDLGDIAQPVVLDCMFGKFVPPSGVARIPVKYLQRWHSSKPAKTYHGSIQPTSPFYDDQMAFIGQDSILIFLNGYASRLTGMACAELYRLARVNKFYQLDGVITDYYIDNDSVAERLTYDAGDLTGPCIFYYPNGQIKEMGLYGKNARTGRWEYFYDNGQKEKTIIFTDMGPRLLECYSPNGQVLAEKGNGRFEGTVLTNTLSSPIQYPVKGPIKDGLADGEWTAYSQFIEGPSNVEVFSAGNFKSGTSLSLSGKTKYDKTCVSRFESLHPYEKLDYYGQTVSCADSGPNSFSADAFAGLKQGFKNVLQTGQYKDYTGWVFLDLLIGTSGEIDQKVVRLSQQNDAFEKGIRDMLDHVQYQPWSRKGQNMAYEKFYIVLVGGGNFVIPEELLTNERRVFR
jgi:YD repeat-containing protein